MREVEVAARAFRDLRLLSLVHLRLVELEAVHLAPHISAVALVEGQHQRQRRVQRDGQVAAQQLVREVTPPLEFQVHGQEGDVRRHVRVAEALVELDAVVDADAVVIEADGVCAQVAVAVARPSLAHAQVEEVGVALGDLPDEALDLLELALADGAADERFGLLEVLTPVQHRRLQPAEAVDLITSLRCRVEAGDALGQASQQLGGDGVALQEAGHHPLLRQPAHLHGIIDGGAFGVHLRLPIGEDDGHDVQVGLRAETPVQAQLLLAEVVALLQRREVQKAQVQGLLHLVDEFAGEEEIRDVGLQQLDAVHRVRIGVRREHRLDVAGQRSVGHVCYWATSAGVLKP